jgi:MAC/Perforin domain
LLRGEFGELDADFLQMQARDFFVESFRQDVNADFIGVLVLPEIELRRSVVTLGSKRKRSTPPTKQALMGNMAIVLPDLSGVWNPVDQIRVLDNRAAMKKGHVGMNDGPPLHGTYVPLDYFRIKMEAQNKVPNTVITVFNQEGDFARFLWNGKDAWVSQKDEVTFQVALNNKLAPKKAKSDPKPVSLENPFHEKDQLKKELLASQEPVTLTRSPSLYLQRYTKENCPSNASPGDLYIDRYRGDLSGLGAIGVAINIVQQKLTYDATTGNLTWISAPNEGGATFHLELERCFQQQRQTGTSGGADTIGDTFKGQVKLAKVEFPFYGWNPSKMDSLHDAVREERPFEWTPGTNPDPTESNPMQGFSGRLVFSYPTENSKDYVRGIGMPDAPFLPLGISAEYIESSVKGTHTEMISSMADQMRSWSLTLGLSAGVEGVFDVDLEGSYSTETESETKAESRYTVSRKVEWNWKAFSEFPSLQLHEKFLNQIKARAITLASGAKLDDGSWEDFVLIFGTHYAHAITYGALEYMETRFSLAAESIACTQAIDLKAKASVVIEGADIGAKDDYSTKWTDKFGSEISTEDVKDFSVGSETCAMPILLDLRPLPELLSPIFFDYNPADDWQQLAPWVWYELRKGFCDYLTSLGLNQPITGPNSTADFTPGRYVVTVPSVMLSTVTPDLARSLGGSWTVKIDITEWVDTDDSDGRTILSVGMPAGMSPPGLNARWTPDAARQRGIVAVKPGTKDPLSVRMNAVFELVNAAGTKVSLPFNQEKLELIPGETTPLHYQQEFIICDLQIRLDTV